jgi:cobalamin biosynthesis Mg chelatase CobN
VLALLAFACFPVVAQAETVYEPEDTNLPNSGGNPPSTPHKNTDPDGSSPGADVSNAPDGNGGSEQPGDESSRSQDAASGGGNPGSPGGGGDAQGKGEGGGTGAENKAGGKLQSLEALNASTPANADDDSSSPLVPILIAVAVLAAISVGAVLARQRRGSGSPVSPKAS